VEGLLADIWKEDEGWMEIALREAEKALEGEESPVGAVVVTEGQVVGRGYNRVETLKDPTAHAEILAIGAASEHLGSWRLPGCTLYVTLEPCTMCAGAIVLCRIDRVVFGAYDPKAGACGSVLDVFGVPALNHHPEVRGGVLDDRCGELLKSFFAGLRRGRETENTE
jgi:tRNA(adenine34) deaminase